MSRSNEANTTPPEPTPPRLELAAEPRDRQRYLGIGLGGAAVALGTAWVASKGLPGEVLAHGVPELSGTNETESPLVVGGIISFLARQRVSAALKQAEAARRTVEVHRETARAMRSATPVDPSLLPTTEGELKQTRKAGRQREKNIAAGYEQWSYDRWNTAPAHALQDGQYRTGKLVGHQIGDMGTPAFTERVARDAYPKDQQKSLMRQHGRHQALTSQRRQYESDNWAAQAGEDKASRRLRERSVDADRKVAKRTSRWSRWT